MDQPCQSVSGGQLHAGGHPRGVAVQRATEDAGEDQAVVDLIGEVAAAGAHHGGPCGPGLVGPDLRDGIGHRENDGVFGH